MPKIITIFFFILSLTVASTSFSKEVTKSTAVEYQGTDLETINHARAELIKNVCTVKIFSYEQSKFGRLISDNIDALSTGFIFDEQYNWETRFEQLSPNKPPVPRHRVTITAKVRCPLRANTGLNAERDCPRQLRAKKDYLKFIVNTHVPAKLAVFNLQTNGKVVMIYPNAKFPQILSSAKQPVTFPPAGRKLRARNLPGHTVDDEYILIAALQKKSDKRWLELFTPETEISFSDFFKQLSEVKHDVKELHYTITAN